MRSTVGPSNLSNVRIRGPRVRRPGIITRLSLHAVGPRSHSAVSSNQVCWINRGVMSASLDVPTMGGRGYLDPQTHNFLPCTSSGLFASSTWGAHLGMRIVLMLPVEVAAAFYCLMWAPMARVAERIRFLRVARWWLQLGKRATCVGSGILISALTEYRLVWQQLRRRIRLRSAMQGA